MSTPAATSLAAAVQAILALDPAAQHALLQQRFDTGEHPPLQLDWHGHIDHLQHS